MSNRFRCYASTERIVGENLVALNRLRFTPADEGNSENYDDDAGLYDGVSMTPIKGSIFPYVGSPILLLFRRETAVFVFVDFSKPIRKSAAAV